ncbi:hypothetical protein K3758_06465 [Sulfitobacter sp. W002]|uniref:hypothetical protein n=1 Tax=Sulfitobacter sp. W002 TaxID=2867024 RepID=UPI0021A6D496|nr:hypothetical protein [Sulfitobacter sp. W002]UWR31153.1 hypothetical protein K3758_06465 [Sulfitobacter sp. W002]
MNDFDDALSDGALSDDALENFFAAARTNPPQVSADLQARVLADAEAHMPKAARQPWHQALWHLLGGAAGLSGLATAAAVGVWVGVAPPEGMPDLAGQFVSGTWTAETLDTSEADTGTELGGFGWDMEES